MASHRAFTTGASATVAAQGFASHSLARDATQASGRRCLKRAALYARVSTDRQEREETVASQVDLLYQTAAAHDYEVLTGSVFIDNGGVSAHHLHGFGRFRVICVCVLSRCQVSRWSGMVLGIISANVS
jgi:predicted site-specific integrase-resolvase